MTQLLKWSVGKIRAAEEAPPQESSEKPSANFTVLSVGQNVSTPKGEAQISSIALQGLTLSDGKVELDLPLIKVRYLSDGVEEQICLCSIQVHDPDHQKILDTELERLWPPLEPDVATAPRYDGTKAAFTKELLKSFKTAENLSLIESTLPHKEKVELREQLEKVAGVKAAARWLSTTQKKLGSPRQRVASFITACIFAQPKRQGYFTRLEQSLLSALVK